MVERNSSGQVANRASPENSPTKKKNQTITKVPLRKDNTIAARKPIKLIMITPTTSSESVRNTITKVPLPEDNTISTRKTMKPVVVQTTYSKSLRSTKMKVPLREDNTIATRKTTQPMVAQTKSSESVRNLRRRMRKSTLAAENNVEQAVIIDPYEHLYPYKEIVKKRTIFYYHEDMEKHIAEDPDHPENPDRHKKTLEFLNSKNILQECIVVKGTSASLNEMGLTADRVRLEEVLSTSLSSLAEQEKLGATNDSIYICENSLNAIRRAVGSCIEMTVKIASGEVKNGFALVRPPGHHASDDSQNGYCFINNVATAAKVCLEKKLASRILIVDIDVHHGNGTQKIFYESKNVLFFSIHRYENGKFWPYSQLADFNKIGEGNGKGFNINVPLNETGLTDGDYMAIVHHLLLPIANEYNPDLIIISTGFDAVLGDPEGQMKVTPAFYGHLVTLLSGLANGKLSACLEGGYSPASMQLAVYMTIKSLLGHPCESLGALPPPKKSLIATINNVRTVLRHHWRCFDMCPLYNPLTVGEFDKDEQVQVDPDKEILKHSKMVEYEGLEDLALNHPELLGGYPQSQDLNELLVPLLLSYRWGTRKKVGFCYNEVTLLHSCNHSHPEQPNRVTSVMEMFKEWELDKRMIKITGENRDDEIRQLLEGSFSREHMAKIRKHTNKMDLYINKNSIKSVYAAVGGLLDILDGIINQEIESGIAIIRPPGHHCSPNRPAGFCLVNNVAVGANYLIDKLKCKKVLILDFDVHHGNGTQKMFYSTSNVLYISVHKYMDGSFYPNLGEDGDVTSVGEEAGKGYNVNIPLNLAKAGNKEYLTIFHTIILPIVYSYGPDWVIVSAGFDAGINDPLGHYQLSPEVFGHFVQYLKALANGKLILVLEGGYHFTTTSYGMVMCAKALLNDPLPSTQQSNTSNLTASEAERFKEDMSRINLILRQYWPVLNVFKALPREELISNQANQGNKG